MGKEGGADAPHPGGGGGGNEAIVMGLGMEGLSSWKLVDDRCVKVASQITSSYSLRPRIHQRKKQKGVNKRSVNYNNKSHKKKNQHLDNPPSRDG